MNDIMLSVYVATYNHEKYIIQALDSILMQETKYKYEVLVGEDCSIDNTREVLKEYQNKHSDRIQFFYREQNMSKEPISNGRDLQFRCRGKYIIALEGDDFWIDSRKIEKQIDYLENHPECIAVSHKCTIIDHNSEEIDETYPECNDNIYTFRHYVSEILPGQLTTVMYRNMFRCDNNDLYLFKQRLRPGDRVLYFWLLMNGEVHCMPDNMSAYRHVTNHGSSWSANYKYNFVESEKLYFQLLKYSQNKKHIEAERYAEFLYFKCVLGGIRKRQCRIKDAMKLLKHIQHKVRAIGLYIQYRIKKNILHKKLFLS